MIKFKKWSNLEGGGVQRSYMIYKQQNILLAEAELNHLYVVDQLQKFREVEQSYTIINALLLLFVGLLVGGIMAGIITADTGVMGISCTPL